MLLLVGQAAAVLPAIEGIFRACAARVVSAVCQPLTARGKDGQIWRLEAGGWGLEAGGWGEERARTRKAFVRVSCRVFSYKLFPKSTAIRLDSARQAAFASRSPCLLAGPLVGSSLRMRGL